MPVTPERWYAGRRRYDRAHRPRHFTERLRGQPAEGFVGVGEVMGWLAAQGRIVRKGDPEDDVWDGWGDPFCAVSGDRNDPWEDAAEAALLAAAAAANEAIESCHERVACPKCGAQVGYRCMNMARQLGPLTNTKHPHRERWTQVVAAR